MTPHERKLLSSPKVFYVDNSKVLSALAGSWDNRLRLDMGQHPPTRESEWFQAGRSRVKGCTTFFYCYIVASPA
jgi:hypothetical protein